MRPFSRAGKILRVNLSDSRIKIEDSEGTDAYCNVAGEGVQKAKEFLIAFSR